MVLSQEEIKCFLTTPKLLKHRLIIGLLYGCGLRRFELLNIQVQDIDLDRKVLHIRQGKGRKDRYVPLGELLCKGLTKYLRVEQPKRWLFYRKDREGKLLPYSESGVQWVIKTTRKLSGTHKAITTHSLRHSYATHLLEQGLDIVTLKELLGHSALETTMIYLHVGQLGKEKAFSPLDRIYGIGTNS